MSVSTKALLPGQNDNGQQTTLGVMGGGQLGRMFVHSAQQMGYFTAVLDPDVSSPAGWVSHYHIETDYLDQDGLAQLMQRSVAITTEFENVPAPALYTLGGHRTVAPSAKSVAIAQHRVKEKTHFNNCGVACAPFQAIESQEQLSLAMSHADLFPAILKTSSMGYDGKGQARVRTLEQAIAAFTEFGSVPCVLEAMLDLKEELSVVMARGLNGECAVFPVARNVHHEGILAVTTVDMLPAAKSAEATEAALAIARGLDYHGVMCVEFFVLGDGQLLVNEIAPRPHNSGHFTMNACVTSQFEQQARVMAGLPLGSTRLLAPVVMLNILGDAWYPDASDVQAEPDWAAVLAVPGASLHLYGKREARRARKMGHVNITGANLAETVAAANRVVQILRLPVAA